VLLWSLDRPHQATCQQETGNAKIHFCHDAQKYTVRTTIKGFMTVAHHPSRSKALEATSTSSACPRSYHCNMLESGCSSGIPTMEKSTRQRLDICSCYQRSTTESHVSLPIFPHHRCRHIQHILGLDRFGDEAHGAVLPVEQRQWSTWEGFATASISILFPPIRSAKGI
jgi:hypothetical protein